MKDCTATSRPETPSVSATSSTPNALPGEQEALFREVLLLLNKLHCSYAVAGAFALRQHTGICRYTKDLDVFLTATTASDILPAFNQRGFKYEVSDPAWLAKVHRGGYFVDFITGMSNGVIVVEDSWIERSYPAEVCGVNSRVLAPEEMLASKLFVTRRERFDGADIAHIIFASRGKLDWDRILQLAGEHWELVLWALVLFRYVYPAHSGYVPQSLWGDLLGRLAENVRFPQPSAKFRGTLVDDAMFAIDVEEWGLDNLLREHRARRTKISPRTDSRRAHSKMRGGR
jgi:Nucleotidyl transferase of unknown function (DUF2204)